MLQQQMERLLQYIQPKTMKFKNVCEVESFSGFGSDGASVMFGNKGVASKLKRNNPKIISIFCHNHRLALTILTFFKESTTFLMKNNYLMC